MRFGTYTILAVIVAAGGLFWGSRWLGSSEGNLPPLHTVHADHGQVSQRIVAHGTLQPVQKVTVGSQVSGIIDLIAVDFNSPVRRGQVIAQIDPSTFAAAVSSAEAELASAQASLELAELQYRRTQELLERQFVSASDVDEARAQLHQAQAQVRVRTHALDRAQRELDRCTITSPTDGIVISRNVDEGQTVAASLSTPDLFEIATDLSQMHIYANVSEADIGQIAEGQRVVFLVDAYRGQEFHGEVIQVRNAPLMQDNVVHYETIIAVNNEDMRLKPGMTTEVNIISDERQDVLRVRNTALRARLPDALIPSQVIPYEETAAELSGSDGRIYVLNNGDLEARQVRTGLSDGLNTEILAGTLTPSDTLVVGIALRTGQDGGRTSLFRGNQAQY